MKKWYEKNREKWNKHMVEYRKTHKEQCREYDRRYRETHKEELKAKRQTEEYKAKAREYARKRYHENIEKERPEDTLEEIVWDLWVDGDLNLYQNSYDVDCSTEEIQEVEDD